KALFSEAAELYEWIGHMFALRTPPHLLVYDRLVEPELDSAWNGVVFASELEVREGAALLAVDGLPAKGAGTPVTDLQWSVARRAARRFPAGEHSGWVAMWQRAEPESYPGTAAGLPVSIPAMTYVWDTREEAVAHVRREGP